ncbi:hypothetical protein M2311_000227 [Rhizobium leguminosarum]|uniref:TniQ family protein n=1 Tax=Rhizobium leguminosarum TaxID=384 RepID=UPI002474DF90|nr:TniQ family protein [Rhizobium leguminosarum]MDH6270166.1 hypothetical protein [Rhizobium leguminosarum]
MTLPVPVAFHSDEIPGSYADRLSAANGFPTNRMFFTMTAIEQKALERGESEPVSRLAYWSGEDPDRLSRFSAPRPRKLHWSMGAAVFKREAREGNRFRYCPKCVVADWESGRGRPVARPYVRATWATRSIRSCTLHQRPLVEVADAPEVGDSFCRFAMHHRKIIELQAAEEVGQPHMGLDLYVADRINGQSNEPYLDRFETHLTIDLCTYFGSFVKRHKYALAEVPRHLRAAPAREIGYYVARQGEQRIREVATRILEAERHKAQIKLVLGSLGAWVRRNVERADMAEIVELFQDVAERTLAYAVGEPCFLKIRHRYLHTVKSASVEYGLFEDRVVQLLRDAKLIDETELPYARIYFDAAKAHEILTTASRTLNSREAREMLGVTEEVMARILDKGLLPRVENRNGIRVYSRILREDLEAFQKRLFANVTMTPRVSALKSITTVCRLAGCNTEDMLSAIISGEFEGAEAAAGGWGRIDALRIDARKGIDFFVKTRKSLSEVVGVPVMTQREGCGYMRVKPETMPCLIKRGYLETTAVNNQVNGRRQTVVTIASMDAFMAEHMRLGEVAEFFETSPQTVADKLADVEIMPIYDGTKGTRFYRKSEIIDAPIEVFRPRS